MSFKQQLPIFVIFSAAATIFVYMIACRKTEPFSHLFQYNTKNQVSVTEEKQFALHLRNQTNLYERAEKTLFGFCRNRLHDNIILNFRSRVIMPQLRRIHLLVTMNKPLWKIVPLVDSLYRPFFPQITFCSVGGNLARAETLQEHGYNIVTYEPPDADLGAGWVAHKCWIDMVDKGILGEDTVGLLGIHDDQLLAVGPVSRLNPYVFWRSKSWDQHFDLKTEQTCLGGDCKYQNHWEWFGGWSEPHMPRYNGALRELRERAARGEQPFKKCQDQLVRVTGGEMRLVGGHTVDMSYVPVRYLKDYSALLKVFFKHPVFVEVAIATVQVCLEDANQTQDILGINTWSKDRDREPWVNYNLFLHHKTNKYFYHPIKWSPMLEPSSELEFTNYRRFLCESVLPYLHQPIDKLPKRNNKKLYQDVYNQVALNMVYLKAKNKT